jgi:methionyl-tRNA formyltransferase
MQVEAGLDTGPVFACARTPIDASDTAGSLRDRLVDLGTALLVEHLPRLAGAQPEAQRGDETYAEKLGPEDFRVDPARPVAELVRVVQAGDPRPGAWVRAGGQRFKLFGATASAERAGPAGALGAAGITTVDGTLHLREIQPEGKRRMVWDAWRRGHPDDLVIDA